MTQKSVQSKAGAARARFWIGAVVGVPASVIAWGWYGLARMEEWSEQSKALAAGSDMTGTAAILGGIPLVLAHLAGLVVMLVCGWLGYRRRGLVFAVLVVAVVSLIGLGIAQLFFEGKIFLYGADYSEWVP